RRLLAFHLRRAGADVTLATNGVTACELALAAAADGAPFDLVLMDVQMPELDGYAATTRLRAAGYGAPIVALTAHVTPSQRERCLAAGCDDFATKPIPRRALLDIVARWISAAEDADDGTLVSNFVADPELERILATFVRRLPERIAAMERAVQVQDSGTVAALAHQLKGAATGYGFPS